MKQEEIYKGMLKTIRILNENEVNLKQMGGIQPNDQDYQEEISKFKSQITPRVDITRFEIYPKTKNVIFGGTFNDISGFNFEFSLEESDGLYINTDAVKLSDDVVTRINKLSGYYKNWADEWANKVITDYANELEN